MKLLIASRNRHKVAEIRAIFVCRSLDFVTTEDYPGLPEVEEDGATFEENAKKKAVVLARCTKEWTLADDSGLVVDALGGLPGVISARYAGEPCNDAANNRKLLAALGDTGERTAHFECVLALAGPDGKACSVSGRCRGRIARACRGARGFGYDPLFVPDGYTRTFGELEPELKNRISHRARALAAAWAQWGAFLRAAAAPDGNDPHARS
ncbi:MAG: RdgB/HAM1 family non-canonical purine NTP pyrophosphatase [Kiritimatiellae bacterium]|nr:RdgB/HAM1 family non-canonical purine NTP pyrophosphatase [Kiritimatiellia bacterium]